MPTVIISGGTGLVGKALTQMLLHQGYEVIVLTRDKNRKKEMGIQYAHWDIKNNQIERNALLQADYIIHLAGAGVVDKKWTPAYKKEIVESRTKSIRLIIDGLRETQHHVKAIISSSAIGWYGSDKNDAVPFVETDPPADNFLGETCRLWEESAEDASQLGIRVCKLRTGIVLSNDGGAMTEFKKPLKLGIAAILGSGTQMVSWIHIDDLCRMFLYAIENPSVSGSYNAVSPHPVSNKSLMLSLAKNKNGKFFVPFHVPVFILKIIMGSRSIEVLKSTTISAKKILSSGFSFLYPDIESCMKQLTKNHKSFFKKRDLPS
jgi:uncharacterized protein (TIGR01777 family)